MCDGNGSQWAKEDKSFPQGGLGLGGEASVSRAVGLHLVVEAAESKRSGCGGPMRLAQKEVFPE